MKKIVPFTKDIVFDNSIYEINSISLEHTLSLKEENIINGNFTVSGTYKMTSSSMTIDEFSYDLPFEINIDKKYDTKNVVVDINDFYYEVVDNKILSINIEVLVDNLEEVKVMEEIPVENIIEEDVTLDRDVEFIEEPKEVMSSIFESLDDNENYVTYKVHIVTENDTKESIIQKYQISSNKLELYNDLSDLKIGDKLIIPANDQDK